MQKAYNNSPEVKSKKLVNSSSACDLCRGAGFRPVIFKGLSAVTKCVCRGGAAVLPGVDYKAVAAGEPG